jgi:flagellar biosynthesis protein FliR
VILAALAVVAAMDPQIWVAIIGFPVNLIAAVATLVHARRADKAVNHRVTNTTISQDVADMKVLIARMSSDIVWLTREFAEYRRSHVDGQDERG